MVTAALPLLLSALLATATAPAPALLPAPLPPPAPASPALNLYDNFAIPTFQMVVAEGMVIGSFVLFDKVENGATLALVLLSPLTVPIATCLIGSTSLRYRGRCGYSFAGMALGIVSGVVVLALLEGIPALNPFHPGYDDTQEFVNTVAAAAYVMFVGIPVGSVLGWNLGKQRLDAAGAPPPPPPPPPPPHDSFFGRVPSRFMLPVLTLRF